VAAGAGTSVTVPLTALRLLTVHVDASGTPVGDGEGPLSVAVVDNPDLGANEADVHTYGIGYELCADVADAPFDVYAVVIGTGPYYVTGALNDLGLTGGGLPAGSLSAIDFDPGPPPTGTIPHTLTIPSGDYTPEVDIDLSFVVPLDADAGAVPPNSCADILPPQDGGVDGG
jgi:hypothetical protein